MVKRVIVGCGLITAIILAASVLAQLSPQSPARSTKDPRGPAKGRETQMVAPTALQTDPEALLARIQDLEKRLAAAEGKLRQLEELRVAFGKHTHPYAPGAHFNSLSKYEDFLRYPDQYKQAMIPYQMGPRAGAGGQAKTGPPEY